MTPITFDVVRSPFAGAVAETERLPGVVLSVVDPEARAELAEALRDRGFDVWAVGSGVEAISAYLERTGDVDAVVIDAELPDVSGSAFVRRLRSNFPGVPCVVRVAETGYAAEPGAVPAAVVAAADGPEALTEQIRRVIHDNTDD